ncbi:MAG: DEAD/DEAH box helicase, partial [Endozoicomonas sp.]
MPSGSSVYNQRLSSSPIEQRPPDSTVSPVAGLCGLRVFPSRHRGTFSEKSNEIKALSVFLGFFGKRKSNKHTSSADKGGQEVSGRKKTDRVKSGAPDKSTRHHAAKRKSHSHQGAKKASRQKKEVDNWSIEQFKVTPDPEKTRFHDFELPDQLMHAIQDLGFKYCTPIQAEVLGSTLAGRDAIGKAQTGTGKTAAFLVSTIKQLVETPPPETRYLGEPRAVIIAPTRELALQIGQDAEALTKHLPLHVVTVVGGMDYDKQRRRIGENYLDILVATPGRLLDYCERKDL